MPILLFLKANWKVILIVLLSCGIYFAGDNNGYSRAEAKFEAVVRQKENEALTQKNLIQAKADEISKNFEDYRAATDLLLDSLTVEVENEKVKNAAFATCHAGPNFMRLYSRAATHSGSNPSR